MNLPLYSAKIVDTEDGLIAMSLVTEPATEFEWMRFAKKDEENIQKFTIADEEKHILFGVVMLANTPIYRRNGDYEYYLQFSSETLEMMAEKMLFQNTFNTIDIQHNGEILPKGVVILRELFIKDSKNGIVPNGMENVPDGSLLCKYKINDEDLWEACKNGTLNGFSLEGLFTVEEQTEDEEAVIMELIKKIENKIKK